MTRYVDSAIVEAQIIEKVHKLDLGKVSQCVGIIEHFTFQSHNKKHYAIIFEPLGKSLYDIIQDNHYRGKGTKYDFCRILHEFGPIICPPAVSISSFPARNWTHPYRPESIWTIAEWDLAREFIADQLWLRKTFQSGRLPKASLRQGNKKRRVEKASQLLWTSVWQN